MQTGLGDEKRGRAVPTIMSHAVVPLALGLALGPGRVAPKVIIAGMILAMLPDADVVGFKLGIAYGDAFGHRGASHSLVAAAIFAGLVMAVMPAARTRLCAMFLWFSCASHGLLDTLTSGGLGAALLWPFSDARFHAPVTPIRVSPIGIRNFLSARGVTVLMSEALWIWLPCLVAIMLARATTFLPSRKAHQ